MKKHILFLYLLLVVAVVSYSQTFPIVPRSNSSITVQDSRIAPQFNIFLPSYEDTTEANSGNNLGIDSLGAIIFTYNTMSAWVRVMVDGSKRWQEIGSGSPSGGFENPMTAEGDLILGGVDGDPQRLGVGANGTVLTSNGTTFSWQNIAAGGPTIYSEDGDLADDRILRGGGNSLILDDLSEFIVTSSEGGIEQLYISSLYTSLLSPNASSRIDVTNDGISATGAVKLLTLAGNGDGFATIANDGSVGWTDSPDAAAPNLIVEDWIDGYTSIWGTSGDTLYFSPLNGGSGINITKDGDSLITVSIDSTEVATHYDIDSLGALIGSPSVPVVDNLADAPSNQAIWEGLYWVKIGATWYTYEKADSSVEITQLASPAPLNLTVAGADQINSAWTNVANETNYELQRGLASDYSDATTINSPAANTTTYNNTGLSASTHYYYRIRAVGDGVNFSNSSWANANATTTSGFDSDAEAYFAAVEGAGGTISGGDKTATNTMVLALKSNSLWTKIKYFWPLMGGTSGSVIKPLRGGVDGSIVGGVSITTYGLDPNGTTGYFNTNVVPFASFTTDNWAMGLYVREDANTATVDMGARRTSGPAATMRIASRLSGNISYYGSDNTVTTVATANSLGFYMLDRGSSGSRSMYKNGSSVSSASVASITLIPYSVYVGAENGQGTAGNFSAKEFTAPIMTEHLTAGEHTTLNTIIEAWMDARGGGVQ